MSTLNFTTDIICKKACNVVVKQNCYQVLMQGRNLDLDCLLLWVCFRCLSMSWDRSQSWNKKSVYTRELLRIQLKLLAAVVDQQQNILWANKKKNPSQQKLITLLFSWYMQLFLLFCWQWLEKYFIIKAALHGHFLMIIKLFFLFVFETIWIPLQWLKS